MASDIHEQLTKYLTDAHSIEVQALAQLEKAPDVAVAPSFEQVLREHLKETQRHERLTRALLDSRKASPNRLKDMVMALGGKGFLAFARAMPDTPGKLLAHALSYEGLETAAYELLARVARRADEQDVARAAERIRDEERAMIERLQLTLEPTVTAALDEHPRDDLPTLIRKYLADAHAIEEQAIALLERAPKLVEEAELETVFAD